MTAERPRPDKISSPHLERIRAKIKELSTIISTSTDKDEISRAASQLVELSRQERENYNRKTTLH